MSDASGHDVHSSEGLPNLQELEIRTSLTVHMALVSTSGPLQSVR